ncbi:hypothetical protein V5O48_010811 [Marasmius crinis-equi]|uniref:pectinesterase n=1 Tax=Marasmius crinis-equi TaxID=585013 RepID=A0ABR3F7N6_9AGAR
MLAHIFSLSILFVLVQAASRTSPPSGAIIVRPGTTTSGEFKTIQSAVNSLPSDGSARSIFLFPGTYTEQVSITRNGALTIYGYTSDTSTYTQNQATIAFGLGADTAGSNDASGTLRVHSDNFRLYNVNVKNTRGAGIQAIALSQYGNRAGFYACGLYGYQDTLLANQGNQVYLKGYIEGKTDFIFGQQGSAYFGGNTIAIKGPSHITASGRSSADSTSCELLAFTQYPLVLTNDPPNPPFQTSSTPTPSSKPPVQNPEPVEATTLVVPGGHTLSTFENRVIFKNTIVNIPPKAGLWSLWNGDPASVSNTLFADFNTTGPGASGISRESFATLLTASQANAYSISSAVGSDYASWVDTSYVVCFRKSEGWVQTGKPA